MERRKNKRSIFNYIIYFIFITLILLLSMQVFTRYVINKSVTWSEEVARWFFIWLIYVGCIVGARDDRHIRVTVHLKLFSKRIQNIILTAGDILWIAFSIVITVVGFIFFIEMFEFPYKSITTGINLAYIYFIIPLAFGLMSFFTIKTLIKRLRDRNKLEIRDSRLDV